MPKGRIRIKLKAYDGRVIDIACRDIINTGLSTGAKISGPVPLPTKIGKFTVLTSPHTDKDAREQFEMRIHKRFIDIIEPTNKTIDSLTHLELPAGVDIELKM
ncbi:MAG: 30S ribosomal protein S10 [Candidatus Curtissbacteria bacterium]|nr:30S ribosomal protein S10 [Candidatus Curtissbacteria bacterium]